MLPARYDDDDEIHEKVFQCLKNSIRENLCLAYFNPNANTI